MRCFQVFARWLFYGVLPCLTHFGAFLCPRRCSGMQPSSTEMVELPIRDRAGAGRALSLALQAYRDRKDVLVLALPRGGVPVAYEIATELDLPLDLMLVRKLGVPGQRELAMGAIASGGIRVLNTEVISSLSISDDVIDRVAGREREELERRETLYRGTRPWPEVAGKLVILVDDGLATGSTVRAAVAALRQRKPAAVIVAVPVAPPDTVRMLRGEAERVICLAMPEPFIAIGRWYLDFTQVSDDEVRQQLNQVWSRKF